MTPGHSELDIVRMARAFHDAYEVAAKEAGWETQKRSRVPWEQVPDENKWTMIATVRRLLEEGRIERGPLL